MCVDNEMIYRELVEFAERKYAEALSLPIKEDDGEWLYFNNGEDAVSFFVAKNADDSVVSGDFDPNQGHDTTTFYRRCGQHWLWVELIGNCGVLLVHTHPETGVVYTSKHRVR